MAPQSINQSATGSPGSESSRQDGQTGPPNSIRCSMAETKHTPSPADIAGLICRAVAELPDRNSPEDWPEAMLVTHKELRAIVLDALASPASATPAVQQSELELKGPADFDHLTPLSWDADYRDLWLRWQAAEANKMIYRRAWLSVAPAARPRFAKTYCSQCGASLGPGNEGASSCCDHGACPIKARGEDDCPTCNPIATPAKLDLLEAAQAYRDAQDALDNREYAGINAEPHEVLMRRRNAARDDLDAAIADQASAPAAPEAGEQTPVDMVLHCPDCGLQHIDAPTDEWSNPPHRSHLCHGCGHTWRPADVPTNGVAAVKTTGKADSPLAPPTAGTPAAAGLSALTKDEFADMVWARMRDAALRDDLLKPMNIHTVRELVDVMWAVVTAALSAAPAAAVQQAAEALWTGITTLNAVTQNLMDQGRGSSDERSAIATMMQAREKLLATGMPSLSAAPAAPAGEQFPRFVSSPLPQDQEERLIENGVRAAIAQFGADRFARALLSVHPAAPQASVPTAAPRSSPLQSERSELPRGTGQ